jgi:hypothetical protein
MHGEAHARCGVRDSRQLSYQIFELRHSPFPEWLPHFVRLDVFARFHVVPYDSYMKLTMSGPKGVITICNNLDQLLRTEEQSATFAVEALAAKDLSEMRTKVDKDDFIPSKHSKSTSFKPYGDIIKIQVHPEDSSKMTSIGSGLDPK